MIEEIELHREEVQALCRRFHVRQLDLFGSAARGDFDLERSDIDFLVEFDRGHPEALSFETYFGFKESLEALLSRPVDLVEPGAVRNPYLKASIDGSRELVFARDPKSLVWDARDAAASSRPSGATPPNEPKAYRSPGDTITPPAFHAPRWQ